MTDRVGAEVMELSPENFRQVLARARRDLYSFMNNKCGLVNTANACRCARKTRGFIDKSYVAPKQVLPEMARTLSSEHEEHNRALDEVERAFEVAVAERTGAAAHLAYRVRARFTAHFLATLRKRKPDRVRSGDWRVKRASRLG